MSPNQGVCIIGGGFSGLAAAYELSIAGVPTTLIEAASTLGGLAGSFKTSRGHTAEKFYHHWFTSDDDVLGLLDELGMSGSVEFRDSKNGIYYANSLFRLSNPFDLLRFSPLPFFSRLRTGLMALRARRLTDWRALEGVSAAEWIRKNAGEESYQVIWRPLLKGKFGSEAENVSAVWFWNKIKLRGSSRNRNGREQLGYYRGGFAAATEGIRRSLLSAGVRIVTDCKVDSIESESGKVTALHTNQGVFQAPLVLATVPLPEFLRITPGLPEAYISQCRKIRFLASVCLVLRLKRSLGSTYWLNVADPNFPFVGVIEHTNFDSPVSYGGEHLAYISKYLPESDEVFSYSESEFLEYCLPYISKIFPEFDRDWIVGFHVWRARDTQPVISKHYSSLVPSTITPIEGLYLATMAQVYPEDRGTNYAVREGRKAGKVLAAHYAATQQADAAVPLEAVGAS